MLLSMPDTSKVFQYTDPRLFPGDPYEAAAAGVAQLEAMLSISRQAAKDATILARNAEMERAMAYGGGPDAAGWPGSPQGRKYAALLDVLRELGNTAGVLKAAAAYNPKHPPTEDK
jgi:hypothetical protein